MSRLADVAMRDESRIADMRLFPLSADARMPVNANRRLLRSFDKKFYTDVPRATVERKQGLLS
jgi:hypothetical protein